MLSVFLLSNYNSWLEQSLYLYICPSCLHEAKDRILNFSPPRPRLKRDGKVVGTFIFNDLFSQTVPFHPWKKYRSCKKKYFELRLFVGRLQRWNITYFILRLIESRLQASRPNLRQHLMWGVWMLMNMSNGFYLFKLMF